MKVNIYYGGRGLIDDPTLYVINKMQRVLEELHVEVERFNLYELKNSITTLPQTLKMADGIILATTVEWHGIGGYMTQFLDACWLYGDKEKISKIYMCPIVMSTTYGEREGKLDLSVAWEILGGLPCSGICGYIADTSIFDRSENYNAIIEKKAENLYKTINMKLDSLPASNQAVKKMVSVNKDTNLTPQESEQLSHYVSDDSYVMRQKADLQELTNMFRDMMGENPSAENSEDDYVHYFKKTFTPQNGVQAKYKIVIEGMKDPLIIELAGTRDNYYFEDAKEFDVQISLSRDIMDQIVNARMTFQRAFLGGMFVANGDIMKLRLLDQFFPFIDQNI